MMATMPRKILSFPQMAAEPENEIIGAEQGLRHVLDAVRLVAPANTAVMIHGETGAGKEVIARAVHEQSRRSRGPYVKVSCAAIPAGLLESELFGHERGAFTGAWTQTTGRFQMADQGTLFLDEVGDLPLELQPISIPPLRERRDDIPQLVWYFVRKFGFKMNKDIEAISDEAMEIIKRHDWPGNIRELQNFIERAMILSPGTVLRPPLGDLNVFTKSVEPLPVRTLAEAERHHIVEAIRQAGGVIGGPKGAAARLGMARTTLLYRMRKLGIGQPLPAITTPQAQAASASA